jgi:hypothetical protein
VAFISFLPSRWNCLQFHLLALPFLSSCVPTIQWFSSSDLALERFAYFGPQAMGDLPWYSSMIITNTLRNSRKVSFFPVTFMRNLQAFIVLTFRDQV